MNPMRRTGLELTHRAVHAFLLALPAAHYDVRAIPAEEDTGPAQLWQPGAPGLLRLIPTLRARNAGGHHIYVRPLDAAYVLVDDLDADGLDALRGAGHVPAATVLTSPHNHQCWLRVAEPGAGPQPEVATEVGRLAAERYGGDPGAVAATQLGRLPGLANRKAMHQRRDGSYPFVLLLSTSHGPDPAAADLLAEARARVEERRRGWPATGLDTDRARGALRDRSPQEEYAEAERRLRAALPPGTPLDRSRLDHALARRLLRRGAGRERVAHVLHAGERAAAMTAADAEAYVARTVAAAERGSAGDGADHGGGDPGREGEVEEEGR
jgi:hypothetical protein